MLSTPHLLVGAACGIVSRNPLVAFGAGFLSHIILDLLPHCDQDHLCYKKQFGIIKLISVIDFLLGIVLLCVLLKGRSLYTLELAFFGACGGFSLDFIDNFIGKFFWPAFRETRIGRRIHAFHEYFHTHTPPRKWILGIATQVASSFGSIIAFYYL